MENILYTEIFTKWYEAKKRDEKRNRMDSHNFNIISMFQVSEVIHSKLLKFLLNPNGEHGQKELFLRLFLESINIKYDKKDIWNVTAEEGRIDLLLKRKNPLSIVIIENKSNRAPDGSNQLYRYWQNEIFKETKRIDISFYEENRDQFQIIYLAPNGKNYEHQSITKPEEELFPNDSIKPEIIPMEIKRLTFNDDINKWIGVCLDNLPSENHRMREYLKQYQEIIKKL